MGMSTFQAGDIHRLEVASGFMPLKSLLEFAMEQKQCSIAGIILCQVDKGSRHLRYCLSKSAPEACDGQQGALCCAKLLCAVMRKQLHIGRAQATAIAEILCQEDQSLHLQLSAAFQPSG